MACGGVRPSWLVMVVVVAKVEIKQNDRQRLLLPCTTTGGGGEWVCRRRAGAKDMMYTKQDD